MPFWRSTDGNTTTFWYTTPEHAERTAGDIDYFAECYYGVPNDLLGLEPLDNEDLWNPWFMQEFVSNHVYYGLEWEERVAFASHNFSVSLMDKVRKLALEVKPKPKPKNKRPAPETPKKNKKVTKKK